MRAGAWGSAASGTREGTTTCGVSAVRLGVVMRDEAETTCPSTPRLPGLARWERQGQGPPREARRGAVDPGHWSSRVAPLSNYGRRISLSFEGPMGGRGRRIGLRPSVWAQGHPDWRRRIPHVASSQSLQATNKSGPREKNVCFKPGAKRAVFDDKTGSLLVWVNPDEPLRSPRRVATLCSAGKGFKGVGAVATGGVKVRRSRLARFFLPLLGLQSGSAGRSAGQ